MADVPPGGAQTVPVPAHPPFPLVRLFYALGFAFVAWFVLWILFFLTAAQFVLVAINGHAHEDIKHFSLSLVQYLWELAAFITFVRDERPFPFGPFPRQA